jgi:outer membrane protein OmpA-like peptidoglycan-associated protein
MKLKFSFLFLNLLIVNYFFSQNQNDTLRLYYLINQYKSSAQFYKLDSMLNQLGDKKILLNINGYADFLGSISHNKLLSSHRALSVKKYIQSKKLNVTSIQIKALGELNSKSQTNLIVGQPNQRRVDVIILNDSKSNNDQTNKQNNISNKNIKATISLKKGERTTLEGLSFEPGRHYLLPQSRPVLESLLETLIKSDDLKIEIQGHICCKGDSDDGFDFDSNNNKLSENRAKVVYDFLIKNGIEANRLNFVGFGHTQPKVFPELSPDDEQANRRVEIKVLE